MTSWSGDTVLRPSHELTISTCNLVNLSVLTEAEGSNVFVDPMLEKTTEKHWLGRDGEKHAKLCLDASQSS